MNSRTNKLIIVILALMLTYVNVNVWSYNDNSVPSHFKQKNKNSTEYYFENEVNLFTIQRTKENISNSLESLYSISYKKIQSYTNQKNQIFEKILTSSTHHFVQFLSKIDLSCAVKQLIYPFDYFW
ncbi:MAG TPA: hypothetical protein PLH91_02575 [Tenuifilaceae bacterium]|nr:hypothetical protein [Tenuifilaceae bacterium]HOZ14890.1 hypothetical protein [Tenuifilaceae bacterium]HPI44092.1 hypothetical protein [Tenuifilaceae bacterium]HPN20273.1 hypothetical protein [Tenuifilaceae bacterium]